MKKTNSRIPFTRDDVIAAISANTTGAARSYSCELANLELDEPAWLVYVPQTGYHELVWGDELSAAWRWAWLNGVEQVTDLYRVFSDGRAYRVLRHE